MEEKSLKNKWQRVKKSRFLGFSKNLLLQYRKRSKSKLKDAGPFAFRNKRGQRDVDCCRAVYME